jgi:hypothetical protein
MSDAVAVRGLPVRGDLGPACISSLVIALAVAAVSLAGLVSGFAGLYGSGSPLPQVSMGGDAANLLLGLPVLLGSMQLARRGSLLGLLLWPGALFYVLYASALYLLAAPFSVLFFGHVALITLSSWTLIGLVACIDGAEVRGHLATAPARAVGAALVAIAVLAYAGLTGTAVAALGGGEPAMRPQWVVDYALGTPALLLGGVLLLRGAPLGYATAAGLLLVSGLNGLAFAASALLDGILAGRPAEPAVVIVHTVIAAVSLAVLALYARPAAGREPAGSVLRREAARAQSAE